MIKEYWKPGSMLYPVLTVMVSCGREEEAPNVVITVQARTICSDPAVASISAKKGRFSHDIIRDTGEFVINLMSKKPVCAIDYYGVKSGRSVDKFAEIRLAPQKSRCVKAPGVEESPVNIERKVVEIKGLGSHDISAVKVMGMAIDNQYMDNRGKLNLNTSRFTSYSHSEYFELGKKLDSFEYSVKKTIKKRKASAAPTKKGRNASKEK